MTLLPASCCCGCTSSGYVFVPCSNTYATTEVRPPFLTAAQLALCGMSPGTVYRYDPALGECDPYCGSWRCVPDADDPENQCNSTYGPPCPDCAPWDNTLPSVVREYRDVELAALCPRFTDVADCCADECPTDCGYGDIVPADCADPACYTLALLSWSLTVSGQNLASSSCTDVFGQTFTITASSITAQNVVAFIDPIDPAGLIVQADVHVAFTWSPDLCAVLDCTDPNPSNYWWCYQCDNPPGDPGTNLPPNPAVAVYPMTWKIPCMLPAYFYGTQNPFWSNNTACGGASAAYPTANPPTFGSLFGAFAHAIGWGGAGVVWAMSRENTYSATLGPCYTCNTAPTQGRYRIDIELWASLPQRPATCP